MGLSFINGDGGQLPPGAGGAAAGNLLEGFAALPAVPGGVKAAWRGATAPQHHVVPEAAEVVSLAQAMPGDTAGVAESSTYLFLLTAADPTANTNWTNLLTGTTAPAP